jgi:hypothetical protein
MMHHPVMLAADDGGNEGVLSEARIGDLNVNRDEAFALVCVTELGFRKPRRSSPIAWASAMS